MSKRKLQSLNKLIDKAEELEELCYDVWELENLGDKISVEEIKSSINIIENATKDILKIFKGRLK